MRYIYHCTLKFWRWLDRIADKYFKANKTYQGDRNDTE